MTASDLILQVGLPEPRRREAARLYLEAFDAKLGPILGRGERAEAFLAEALRPPQAIAALDANQTLVGVAGFHDEDGGFVGGGMDLLAAHYGWVGGGLRGLALSLFERAAEPDELLLDGIVVDARRRGMGVGGRLIAAAADLARDRERAFVRLDVIDANPAARRLYERSGFAPLRTKAHPIIGRAFGFRASTSMRLAV